jgi:hypothetical protein
VAERSSGVGTAGASYVAKAIGSLGNLWMMKDVISGISNPDGHRGRLAAM